MSSSSYPWYSGLFTVLFGLVPVGGSGAVAASGVRKTSLPGVAGSGSKRRGRAAGGFEAAVPSPPAGRAEAPAARPGGEGVKSATG